MRQVLPTDDAADVDLLAAYAVREPNGPMPFVRVNMISSLDGAISIDGRSGALGGAGDHAVFACLRTLADVVVVGAGTMRSEGYGPARLDATAQQQRAARGATPVPAIAVVTKAAKFDYTTPFFTEAQEPPLIVTTSRRAPEVEREAAGAAVVLGAGDDGVDLVAAFAALRERGAGNVLVEGGPGLNGDLARADLVDELCLTLSPRIVGGDGPRVMAGPTMLPPIGTRLLHLLEDDGFLFARFSLRHRDR
jgi:riboflavin biosynthesis pyrimidine reductase